MSENKKICWICKNQAWLRLTKGNAEYYECSNCRTLFSEPLDNDNMVGGGNEVSRNKEQNAGRIERIDKMLGGNKKNARVLDFGCGHGMLVDDLNSAGIVAEGYDLFNEEYNWKLPDTDSFNIVTAVEVIEHTSAPFYEVDVIFRALKSGGVAYVETSFVDIAEEEDIELENFFYIAPEVGHSTIFSHHGLDVLMVTKGFEVMQHFNRNVRLYRKL